MLWLKVGGREWIVEKSGKIAPSKCRSLNVCLTVPILRPALSKQYRVRFEQVVARGSPRGENAGMERGM